MGFIRSSTCSLGACVEAEVSGERARIRGSKHPGITLEVSREAWEDFLASLKVWDENTHIALGWDGDRNGIIAGRFEEGQPDEVQVHLVGESRHALRFTPDEWQTFIEGVKNGEFDLA